jgi:hypothetical protein
MQSITFTIQRATVLTGRGADKVMHPVFQIQTINRQVLAVADRPQNLDFSKLHQRHQWFVVAVYPDEQQRIIAGVDWRAASSYSIRLNNYHNSPVDRITCHSHLTPIIRGALTIWYYEKKFDNPNDNTTIIVLPEDN